jgi:predicted SprT family Zn-dependent metalloprotease
VRTSAVLVFQDPYAEEKAGRLLRGLPPLWGNPVRIEAAPGLRDRHGDVHGGAFLRERSIELNCTRAEFRRVLAHELFHFVWLRAGNPSRHSFEELLREEWRSGARGELGWSAEWRKHELTAADIELRSRRWREYCCESFCDTAAWLYSGVKNHDEFTLRSLFRRRRRVWFQKTIATKRLSI